MKNLLKIAAVILLGSATAAHAEGFGFNAGGHGGPEAAWSGLYIGGHGGYAWGDKDWTLIQNAGNQPSNQIGTVITSHDIDGLVGGFQAGFNHQMNSFVVGAEAEFFWTDMDARSTWFNSAGLFRDASTEINWITTVAARAGKAFDRTLVYGKIGGAWADEGFSHTGGSATNRRFFTGDETRSGWLIGGGLEHAFLGNWSVKFEYDFIDFGEERISVTDGERTALFDVDQDIQVVKVGVNYRFNWARPAPAPLK